MFTKAAPWLRAFFIITTLLLAQVPIAAASDGAPALAAPSVDEKAPDGRGGEALPPNPRKDCALRVIGVALDGTLPPGKPDKADGPPYFGIPVDILDDWAVGAPAYPGADHRSGDSLTWVVLVQNSTTTCPTGTETLSMVQAEVVIEGIARPVPLTYPDGNPGTLVPGELAYSLVTFDVPPNVNGTLDVITRAAAEDQVGYPGVPPNDVVDNDQDNITILGPGFTILSFTPSVTEASPGQLVDFTLTIQNTRPGSVIAGIEITSASPAFAACTDLNLTTPPNPWTLTESGTPDGIFQTNETATCTIIGVPIPNNPAPQTYQLSGSIRAVDTGGESLTLSASSSPAIVVNLPDVSITKVVKQITRGGPGNVVPPPAAPGDEITYTITVTNTGKMELHDIFIIDSLTGPVFLPLGTTLPVGESLVVDTSYFVRAGGQDPLVNKATVTARATGFPDQVDAEASAIVDIVDSALKVDLTVEDPATGNPLSKVSVGDTVRYRMIIRNEGGLTISGIDYAALTPPLKTVGVPPAIQPSTVPAGGQLPAFTWDYVILATDEDPLTSTVRIRGTDTQGSLLRAQAQVTLDIATPGLSVDVTVLEPPTSTVLRGGQVVYDIEITNTDTVTTLCGISLNQYRRDPDGGPDMPVTLGVPLTWPPSGTPGQLGPGQTAHAVTTYLVTGQDKDPLQMMFEALSSGPCSGGAPLVDRTIRVLDVSDVQVNVELVPNLGSDGVAQIGENIEFTFLAQNVGSIALENLSAVYCIYHSGAATSTCSQPFTLSRTTMGAFEVVTGSFVRTITQADAEATPFLAEVTMFGRDNQGNEVAIKAAATLTVATEKLIFTLGGPQQAVIGDTETFGYVIGNETEMVLRNVRIYNMLVQDTGDPYGFKQVGYYDTIPVPYSGEVTTGNFDYTIVPGVGISGDILTMQIRLLADTDIGPVIGTASTQVQIIPMVQVIKEGDAVAVAGTAVNYTVTFKNNSNDQNLTVTGYQDQILSGYGVTITNNSFNPWPENPPGSGTPTPGVLPPGTSVTGAFQIPAVNDTPNPLVNVFTVTGTRSSDGGTVSGSDDHVVRIDCPLGVFFTVKNLDDDPDDTLGELLEWRIAVTNQSFDTIDNIIIYEKLKYNNEAVPYSDITWTSGVEGRLGPGQSALINTFTQQVTNVFFLSGSSSMNDIVRLGFSSPSGVSTCPSTQYSYPLYSPIGIIKVPNPIIAFTGDTVNYTLFMWSTTEENDGIYANYDVTVHDSLLRPNPIPFDYDHDGTINPGETRGWVHPEDELTNVLPYVVKDTDPAELVNTVTAEFPDPTDSSVLLYTEFSAMVFTGKPLAVTKTPSTDLAVPGTTITYDYTLTNLSPYPIEDITITDSLIGELVPARTGTLGLPPYAGVAPDALRDVEYVIPLTAPDPLVNTVDVVGWAVLPDLSRRQVTVSLTVAVDLKDSEIQVVKSVYADDPGNPGHPGDPLPDTFPANPDGIPEANVGQEVHYCFTISNTSGASTWVENMHITDSLFPTALQIPFENAVTAKYGNVPANKLIGQQSVNFCYGPIALQTTMGDPVENVVTVTGTASGGYDVFATDTLVVDLRGLNLLITKAPSQPLAYVGDEISYTIFIQNLNTTTGIKNIQVTDLFGASGAPMPIPIDAFDWSNSNVDPITPGVLGPNGGFARYTYFYTIKPTDPSLLSNTATVVGELDNGAVPPEVIQDSTRATVGVTASQLLVYKSASPNVARPGDTVRYTISILNVGTTRVYNITAVDEAYGVQKTFSGGDLTDDTLDPLETAFIYYDVVMPTSAQILTRPEYDPYINVITVQGTVLDSHGDPLPDPVVATATESVDILQPNIRIVKSPTIGAATPGMNVTYNITISNRGGPDETLTGLIFRDLTSQLSAACPDPATCPFTYSDQPVADWDNNPGTPNTTNPRGGEYYDPATGLRYLEQMQGQVTVQVPEDYVGSQFTNIVEITAQNTKTSSQVQDRASATIDIRDDGINVEKTSSVTAAPVETPVIYTLTVMNVGDNPIERLVIADAAMPGGSRTVEDGFPNSPEDVIPGDDSGTLDPGEVYETTYVHTLSASDGDPYVNQVVVTGYTLASAVVNVAEATVDIQTASIGVEKFVCAGVETGIDPPNGDDNDPSTLLNPCRTFVNIGDAIPDQVTYYVHIMNTGPLPVQNLALTDSRMTPPALPQTTLAVGEDLWIMYPYTVQPADPDPIVNTVTASAQASGGGQVRARASATLNLVTGDIQLTKTAVDQAVLGDIVTYTLTVSHVNPASGSQVTNIRVVDPLSPQGVNPICTIPSLQWGDAPVVCTFNHTITLADGSTLVNTATATGVVEVSPGVFATVSDSATHVLQIVTPGLSVTKTANVSVAAIGDTITYTYTVTNTGTVNLDNLSVTDSDPSITFTANPWPTYLPPGGAATRTATHLVVATDPDPLVNTVTVTGRAGTATRTATATETVFIANGSLVVTNTPSVAYARPGDPVTFTYMMRNVGTETLDNLALVDTICGDLTSQLPVTSLLPGASATLYCTTTAALPGPVISTVYAQAQEPGPVTVTDTATAEVPVTAGGLLVTKTADVTVASPGDTIHYTVEITNIGTETLGTFTIEDLTVALDPPYPTTLGPGARFTLHGTYLVPVASPPSSVANTVTVSAIGQQTGAAYQDSASAAVAILEIPGARLALFKEVSATRALPGDTVTYTFRIQNVSANPVSSITLDDDPMLGAPILVDPLAPGNATTLVRPVTIPADWNQPIYTNTATVRSGGAPEDIATVNLLVEVVSLAKNGAPDPVVPGNTITYTFTITNNSSEPVSGVTLADPGVTFGTAPVDMTIPVGGSQVTGTVILPQAYAATTYQNTAQLSVGGVVVDTATDVVTVIQSGYQVEILNIRQNDSGTWLDLIQTGEPAQVTFQLRNNGTGNITGLGATVSVSGDPDATCAITSGPLPTTLVPGGSATVTCDYTPPINPSSLTPTVTVDATGTASGTPVTAQDTSSMTLVDLALQVSVTFNPTDAAVGEAVIYTFTLTNQGLSPLGCTNAAVPDANAACHLKITTDQPALNTLLAPLATQIADTVLAPGATSPTFTTASGTAAPFTATATGGYYTATPPPPANQLGFYTVQDQVSSPAEWSGLLIDGVLFQQQDSGTMISLPDPFQTGEQVRVNFTLRNVGAQDFTNLAYQVTFSGALAGTTCQHVGTALPGTLNAGQNVTVECRFTPPPGLAGYRSANGLNVDVTIQATGTAGTNNIAVSNVTPITLVDLVLEVEFLINSPSDDASTTDRIETKPGDILAFTLRLTNDGASPIGCGSTVAADAPCHLKMRASADPAGGINLNDVFAPRAADIANTVLTVGGQPAQFMVQYTVKDTDQSSRFSVGMEGGYYTNVPPPAADMLRYYVLVPQENSYLTSLLAIGGPELTVAIQVIPNPPAYGQPVSYNISITNTGMTTLSQITAQWTITPLAGAYAPAISEDGIMLTGGAARPRLQTLSGTFTLPTTTLAPGASVTGTYAKTEDQTRSYVFAVVAANGTFTATDSADVTLSPTGVPGSGTGTPTATVDPATLDPTKTEPEVTKTASAETAQPGGAVTWTITVRNSHTSAMTNVTIQDPVPDSMTVGSATTSRGVSVVDGNLITVTTGQMNPGDTVTLTINTTVKPDAASPGEITNTACAQREGGGQKCGSATVSLGPDVGGLPATGVRPTGGGLPGGVLGIALVMLLLSVQASRRRRWIAVLFVVVTLLIAVGGILLLTLGGEGEKEPAEKAETTAVPPADTTPEAGPPAGVMLQFPPTATPYVLPTPAGPRTLFIPKLADQFSAPIPIVELPIVNRQWDISGLGFYVGWLQGTTWMDPQWGNTVLAAHVQLGVQNPGPFWALDQLQPGDEVIVYEGSLERRFTVRSTRKVDPGDWTVTAPTSGPTLTLITCTEWSQAYGVFSQRLVVQAVPAES